MKLRVVYKSKSGHEYTKLFTFSRWENPEKLVSADLILFETNQTVFDSLSKVKNND